MRPKRVSVSFLALVATLAWTGGCDSDDDIIVSTGTLRVSVVNRDLATQFEAYTEFSDPPGWQVMAWEVGSAVLGIPDVAPNAFEYVLITPPCVHRQFGPNELAILDCDMGGIPLAGAGYAMDPTVPLTVSMELFIGSMDIRRADRPLVPPEMDHDGDLVLNGTDNCVLIDNPDQLDFNGDGFGDACSLRDSNGDPTIPDRDGDRVADAVDNCVWIVNPGQADTTPEDAIGDGADGIGEACALIVPIDSPPLDPLSLGPIAVTIEGNTWNFVSASFDESSVICDPAFTSCQLDPGQVGFTSP